MPRRHRKRSRFQLWARSISNAVAGRIATACLRLARWFNREKLANFCGPLMVRIGPWLPEHKVGFNNLRAAFPEKTDAEIETILRGVWDNLGRFFADFAHLDRIEVREVGRETERHDVEYTQRALDRFHALRDSGKPALTFAAHIGNWELPALIAHRYGAKSTVLYRRPNVPAVADAVIDIRAGSMGNLIASGIDAPVVLANALLSGEIVGMLVDQYYKNGVEVEFFGQPTRANPLIARLARQVDCPIYGTRVLRLPGNRFRADITEEIEPVRDAGGAVDVAGTMQKITSVIEGWIRENPDQWLWVHRRWRPGDPPPKRRKNRPAGSL
jgi:KDO2-lipid IV(A) lauroyltransferase